MAEVKCIRIPVAVVDGIATRFFGIEACIRTAAEKATDDPVNAALYWIADEISRLYCDLDVCSWDKAKTQRVQEVSHGS